MPSSKNSLLYFLLALCINTGNLYAVETKITQPIGTLVRTYETTGALPFPIVTPPTPPLTDPTTPVEEVNYICAQWDNGVIQATVPYDTRYPVTETILTQQQHFVRLLVTPGSSSNGAWIMRSQYVRGKTPQELQDIFALRAYPIEIVNAEMPASPDPTTGKNYVLWTGIAGPILGDDHDWGNGGSVQNRLVSDYGTSYFPTYRFTDSDTRNHRQPIEQCALSYRPMAGCGNTYCVASYLDSYVPEAYSDLENVYTALDYLNYVDFGTCPIRCALHQLSPERYDAISFLAFRNALLVGESILEWQVHEQWAHRWAPCIPERKHQRSHPNLFIQSISEFTTKVPVNYGDNFHYSTSGVVACLDWPVHHNVAIGVSAAGLGNRLNWYDCMWHAKSGSAEFGLYINYFPEKFFINGIISGGGNWGCACRTINFDEINRTVNFYPIDTYRVIRAAYSRPTNANFAVHLQAGVTAWQSIVPCVRIAYLFNRQKQLCECGADSLNFYLPNYTTHTLHAHAGIQINHIFEKPHVKLMPQIQLAWAGNFFLRSHIIKAKLCGPTNCLAVCGIHQPGNYFDGSLDLNLIFDNCYTLLARYEAQAKTNFIAHGVKVGLQVNF